MNRNTIKIIIPIISIVLLLYILVYADNYSNETRFSKTIPSTSDRDKLPVAQEGMGLSYGIYDIDGNIDSNLNYFQEKDEIFESFISLSNSIPVSRVYRLITFINYSKTSFYVDGKLVDHFDFKMQPNETIEIPVALDILQEGFYDIIFMIVKDIDHQEEDEEFRILSDLNHSIFLRRTISVQGAEPSEINFSEFEKKENTALTGILLSKEKNRLTRWTLSKITYPKSCVNFYVHIGNASEEEKEFAVILLYDWEQVKMNDTEEVTFIKLPPKTKTVIDSEVLLSPSKGNIEELTAIIIYNPYQVLDYENSLVETAIRVGIINK